MTVRWDLEEPLRRLGPDWGLLEEVLKPCLTVELLLILLADAILFLVSSPGGCPEDGFLDSECLNDVSVSETVPMRSAIDEKKKTRTYLQDSQHERVRDAFLIDLQ